MDAAAARAGGGAVVAGAGVDRGEEQEEPDWVGSLRGGNSWGGESEAGGGHVRGEMRGREREGEGGDVFEVRDGCAGRGGGGEGEGWGVAPGVEGKGERGGEGGGGEVYWVA